MTALVLGLIIFVGIHSVRIISDDFRTKQIEKVGIRTWRAMHAAVSLVGLLLIVVGYGTARAAPHVVWDPPAWLTYLATVLTIPSFILIASAYVPGTRIRNKLGHPMLLGIKLWALAHLMTNGTLADILLFGTFLAWSVVTYASARRRDQIAGTIYLIGPIRRDATAVIAGVAAWAVFALWLHDFLIGVSLNLI
ncbi:MAG: NnrU family protein [Burkholderiales bacterium]|nr:NnrU family protein [Burkholderiales bacterium]